MKSYKQIIDAATMQPDNETARIEQLINVSNFIKDLHPVCSFEVARHLLSLITDERLRRVISKQIQDNYQSNSVEELEDMLWPDALKQLLEIEKELYQRGLIDIGGKWCQGYGKAKAFEAFTLLLIRGGYFKRTIKKDSRRVELTEPDCVSFLKQRYEFNKYSQHKLSEQQAGELIPFVLDLKSVKNLSNGM